ncbi:MAG: serine/threonine protein kinase [Planctomycetes bacterium]|nr:serine/threonine protein kinase [Planctomycetota bacterium]
MRIGPYTLEEELARGGQGVVYRALDTRLERTVVLKLLELEGEDQARRMRREAQAMARLRHPHVVPLHDAGEHEGKPYLVLPYLPAPSLQRRLDERGPLQLEHALRFTADVAQGLAAAHAVGLVHRDVKPANVLVDEEGRALLTDFGLVKKVGPQQSLTLSLSIQGKFLGTPGYWPPEQAHGQHDRVGPPADVYALGGLLYALLTGRPPREVPNLQAVLQAFLEPLQPISELRQDVPGWVEQLVGACLEQDPLRRPSLARVLEALETQSFRARRPRAGAWRYVVGAGGALALTTGLTAWLVLGSRAPDSPAPSTQPAPTRAAPAHAPPRRAEQVGVEPSGAPSKGAAADPLAADRARLAELLPRLDEYAPAELQRAAFELEARVAAALADALLREVDAADLQTIYRQDALTRFPRTDDAERFLLAGQTYMRSEAEGEAKAEHDRLARVCFARGAQLGSSEALYRLAEASGRDPQLSGSERVALRLELEARAARAGSIGALSDLANHLCALVRSTPARRAWATDRLSDTLALLEDRFAVDTLPLRNDAKVHLAYAVAFEATLRPPADPAQELEALERARAQIVELRRSAVRAQIEPSTRQLASAQLSVLERRVAALRARLAR